MTLVADQPLPAMVEESDVAVLVRVSEVRYGFDSRRLHSTFVTFDVEETIYGEGLAPAGEKAALKFYGAPIAMEDGSRVFVDGTPRYRPGERYVLLLTAGSEWGFRATVGLAQGAFRVSESAGGSMLAQSLSARRRAVGEDRSGETVQLEAPLLYEELRETLRHLWTDLGRNPPGRQRDRTVIGRSTTGVAP
jgi:hypothetical protein